MKTRFNRAEKARHWAQWQTSGMTQKAYCERHGMTQSSFKNWGSAVARYPLIPVRVQPITTPVAFRVQWHDAVIELPRDTTAEQWQQLLSALGAKR